MRDRLVALKKGHPGEDERVKTCFQTLMKFCANVATNPGELGGTGAPPKVQVLLQGIKTPQLSGGVA